MIKKYLKLFNPDDYSVVIYHNFDKEHWTLFLKCFKNIFREIGKNVFEWYFLKDNIFSILKNNKQDFIGIYGLFNIKINFSSKSINSYLCHNVGVSNHYSGKGLFQFLGDKTLSRTLNNNNIVLGFPNKASKKGHLRLGWESIAEMSFFKYKDDNREFFIDSKYKFKEVEKFENINFYENNFSLNISKDINYLNWRLSKPNEQYLKFKVFENNAMIGYCIFKTFQIDSIKKLHLVDFNFNNSKTLDQIIKFSILKYKELNCNFVNTWIVENTTFEKEFIKYGFIKEVDMPSYPIILFQKDNEFNFCDIDKEKIFFTLFDNDVF